MSVFVDTLHVGLLLCSVFLCCFGVIPLILMGIDVLHSMNYFQMEVVLTVSGGET